MRRYPGNQSCPAVPSLQVLLSLVLILIGVFIYGFAFFFLQISLTDTMKVRLGPSSFSLSFTVTGINSRSLVEWRGCDLLNGTLTITGSYSCTSLLFNYIWPFGCVSRAGLTSSLTLEYLCYLFHCLKSRLIRLLKDFGAVLKAFHDHRSRCSINSNMISKEIDVLGAKKQYCFAAGIPIKQYNGFGSYAYVLSKSLCGWDRPLQEGKQVSNNQSTTWECLKCCSKPISNRCFYKVWDR